MTFPCETRTDAAPPLSCRAGTLRATREEEGNDGTQLNAQSNAVQGCERSQSGTLHASFLFRKSASAEAARATAVEHSSSTAEIPKRTHCRWCSLTVSHPTAQGDESRRSESLRRRRSLVVRVADGASVPCDWAAVASVVQMSRQPSLNESQHTNASTVPHPLLRSLAVTEVASLWPRPCVRFDVPVPALCQSLCIMRVTWRRCRRRRSKDGRNDTSCCTERRSNTGRTKRYKDACEAQLCDGESSSNVGGETRR